MASALNYRLGGLTIASEFPLFRIQRVHNTAPPDVVIRAASNSEMGEGWINHFLSSNSTPADILCEPLPELRMRCKNGTTVLVSLSSPLPDTELSVYLTGLAWGLICHQRDWLPLHCSAAARDGLAFAFTGVTGAGKSTLLHGLTQRGHHHCCDDIMVTNPGHPARIQDMATGTKLWDDAVAYFGEQQVEPLRMRGGRSKFHVRSGQGGAEVTRALSAIYLLGEGQLGITPLTGFAAWRELYGAIYRADMLPWINIPSKLAAKITALASSTPVYRFLRPRSFDRFNEALDLLEAHMTTFRK